MKKFIIAITIGTVMGVAYSCVEAKGPKSLVLDTLDAGVETDASTQSYIMCDPNPSFEEVKSTDSN